MIEVVIHSSTGGNLRIARLDVMTAHQTKHCTHKKRIRYEKKWFKQLRKDNG